MILYPGAHKYTAELALTPECVSLCRWDRFLLELYGKTECIYCHRVSSLSHRGLPKLACDYRIHEPLRTETTTQGGLVKNADRPEIDPDSPDYWEDDEQEPTVPSFSIGVGTI